MAVLYSNNAASTLAASITNAGTTLSVASGQGALFPAVSGGYFYATLTNSSGAIEIVKVTARTTDTMTIVRGQDGTTAVAWSAGDRFELRITKAMLDDFKLDTQSGITSSNVTTALGFTPYNATNPNGYITSSALSSYLPLTGGTLTNALTISGAGVTDAKFTISSSGASNSNSPAFQFLRTTTTSNTIQFGGIFNWNTTLTDGTTSTSASFNVIGDNTAGAAKGDLYINALTTQYFQIGGATKATLTATDFKIGANSILHAGNYTSYSPSLTGSGASGNWGINISGNAATVSSITSTQVTTALGFTPPKITHSEFAPTSPTAGDLWWNSGTGVMYTYFTDVDTSQWVDVSSSNAVSASGGGISTGKAIAMALVFGF